MPKSRAPLTRVDQKAATRELLLRVGRKTFAKHGFDQTSIATVCRAARVTHGALYHHFPSKTELFKAVLAELFQELASAVMLATEGKRGWAQIDAACDAYLDACIDPVVQAIVLRDGPRVLAHEDFSAIDRDASEPLVVGLLKGWVAEGLLRPVTVELVAPVLGGAFAEAGNAIASAPDQAAARAELGAMFRAWVRTLGR